MVVSVNSLASLPSMIRVPFIIVGLLRVVRLTGIEPALNDPASQAGALPLSYSRHKGFKFGPWGWI